MSKSPQELKFSGLNLCSNYSQSSTNNTKILQDNEQKIVAEIEYLRANSVPIVSVQGKRSSFEH